MKKEKEKYIQKQTRIIKKYQTLRILNHPENHQIIKNVQTLKTHQDNNIHWAHYQNESKENAANQ